MSGDGFTQFWEAYPRREAIERARRQWAQLQPDAALLASILAAVALQRQSKAWQREEGRFIPLPGRWLRGRRWQDGTQVERQRAVRSVGWADEPEQVKAVGASLGMAYSLAALGNGYTDDQRIAHFRRYRAAVMARVQVEEAGTDAGLRCLRCGREGHNSEDCRVQLPREAANNNTKGMQC